MIGKMSELEYRKHFNQNILWTLCSEMKNKENLSDLMVFAGENTNRRFQDQAILVVITVKVFPCGGGKPLGEGRSSGIVNNVRLLEYIRITGWVFKATLVTVMRFSTELP